MKLLHCLTECAFLDRREFTDSNLAESSVFEWFDNVVVLEFQKWEQLRGTELAA